MFPRLVASVLLILLFRSSSQKIPNIPTCSIQDTSGNCASESSKKVIAKAEDVLMQLHASKSSSKHQTRTRSGDTPWCCKRCGDKPFCSPYSGNCYDQRRKDYYKSCGKEGDTPSCCNGCGGKPFCSPHSGSCYDQKKKGYYKSCGKTTTMAPVHAAAHVPVAVGTTTTTTSCGETSWWYKATAFQTIAITEMSLGELYAYLDTLEKFGTRVLGMNVAYFNGPLAMWGGLAMNDPFEVNKMFGSAEEFDKFIAKAHNKGMRVISWMNPSYWWTGSKYFKQAERDMKAIKENGQDWKIDLPADSPARWFQWSPSWSEKQKPADHGSYASYPGEVFNWVWDPDAGYSYRSHWADQPMVDFNNPEFQKIWKRILHYWIKERQLDGFVYDAPDRYLGVETGALDQEFYDEQGLAPGQFKSVITDPARAFSCQFAQLAEGYGDQHEMVVFGLNAVLQSDWDHRFEAWGDIVEGIRAKEASRIEKGFADYDKLLRTNKENNYDGILWQRHHNLPFGKEDPARNALARAISVAGGYLAAVEDPGRAWEWKSECCWWEARPYTGAETMLQDLANAIEACEVFAHGTQRDPFVDSTCCGNCDEKPFCSPNSGQCYDQKRKDYYMACNPATEQFKLVGSTGKFYAVRRYVEDGPTGFAIFNLDDSDAMATIKVPSGFQGHTVSDCVSKASSKLFDTYILNVPAYGFKMISVKA